MFEMGGRIWRMRTTKIKLVLSSHVMEVYEYEEPIQYEFKSKGGRRKAGEPESERAENNRKTACYRAREMVRRLVLCNFGNHSKFMTMTYAENQTDIVQANKDFKKFIKRLRYKYGDFKYIAVPEFQKRGAVHYHVMSDLSYVPNKELAKIWGHGFVKINDIRHVDNVGAYMVKYMLKDTDDPRLRGQKAYLCSKGLDRPVVIRGALAERVIAENKLEGKKEAFASSYTSKRNGEVSYKEYNLKRV